MIKKITGIIVSTLLALSAAQAETRGLSDGEWREDINAAADHIRATHPDPFRDMSSAEFDQYITALIDDLPQLGDKDVGLRLAALVASLKDGHSRLSLPREHPELSFMQGHTGPDAAPNDALFFSTLPFRFYLFDDGLYIVEAANGFEHYIGAKILKIGAVDVSEAVTRVTPILFAENEMGEKLLAADRLALPQVLKHFNIIDDPARVPLTIEQYGETKDIIVAPLGAGAELEISKATTAPAIFSEIEGGARKIHHRVRGERAWYIRIDEIEAFPDYILADFMEEALAAASSARARRIILDLRRNQGGTASFKAAVINSLAQSRYNEFGKTYVLIGRETFSAATMLVNDFEQYTNAVLVGEGSAGRPSHYGDPKKLVLPNSGLTLRVSTIYWQSWLAGDFREFVETHVDAPPGATEFFAGRDGAIDAALGYTPPRGGIAAQMAELFDKGKLQSGIVRFLGWLNTPVREGHDAAADLVAAGYRYLDAGALRKGRFMMVMARDFYGANADAHAGLGHALELNGDAEAAMRHYEDALTLEPDNAVALAGLMRLGE